MESSYNKNILIEFYSNKLIDNLGKKYSLLNMDDDNKNNTYHGEYVGFGLEIEANYKDKRFDNPYIQIWFYSQEVYSSNKGIILKGTWQKVLSELYEKIPVFLYYQDETHKNNMHAKELYEEYIKPVYDRIQKINDNLEFYSYSECDELKENRKNIVYHKTIKYNDVIVLDIIDNLLGIKVCKYYPGNWENEIIDYFKNHVLTATEESKELAEKELARIRKISKYY